MRALVLVQPGRVELQQRADPTPGPGEVLLKVEATTLCGTDLRIISGAKTAGVRPGVVMGHEIAGRVAALGDGDLDGQRQIGARAQIGDAALRHQLAP